MFESYLKPTINFPTLTGSIVTFNSQYAGLPLKSHKIALHPSLSGYSDINIGNAIAYDTNIEQGTLDSSGLNGDATNRIRTADYIPVVSGHTYKITLKGSGAYYLGVSGYTANDYVTARTQSTAWLSNNTNLLIDAGVKYIRINVRFMDSSNITPADLTGILVTDITNYHTIQIGSTVYGGKYDARTGIYSGAYNKIVLNGTQALRTTNWNPKTNSVGWIYQWSVTQNAMSDAAVAATILTDNANINAIPYNTIQNQDGEGISVYTSTGWFGLILRIADTSLTNATAINNYMSQNPLSVVFPLETPTTIQLPPCPIDTLLGENNIWADTGNTTLQYIKLG